MDEDENFRRQQQLMSDELARKEAEIITLKEMMGEPMDDSPFRPRASLVRTPPSSFSTAMDTARTEETPMHAESTPQPCVPKSGKRLLTSPEEVQEAVRRRTAKKSSAPPVSGILTTGPTPATAPMVSQPDVMVGPHTKMDKEALIGAVHTAIKAITAVANASNKLNMGDKTTIAGHGQDVIAIVAQLALRLAATEHEVSATKLAAESARTNIQPQPTLHEQQLVPSYANALKMPNGKPPMPVQHQGPAVIFYPASDAIKTSDDTKRVLQEAVKPAEVGIRVTQVRKVGNSGVVVRTATAEAAAKLRSAVPAGLRVAEPKSRLPRVALRYLSADVAGDAVVEELHRINLADDAAWPLDKFKKECKFAVRKQIGPKYLYVLECSKAARDTLIKLSRVYVGWDEAEVCDHIRATCCTKCQQYGHPEKYCKAKELTCGKCGETGHKSTECKSQSHCCATCKRFKRKEANSHATAAASCPARKHAEQQAANMIQYG